jgi:hypothetical protein
MKKHALHKVRGMTLLGTLIAIVLLSLVGSSLISLFSQLLRGTAKVSGRNEFIDLENRIKLFLSKPANCTAYFSNKIFDPASTNPNDKIVSPVKVTVPSDPNRPIAEVGMLFEGGFLLA